MWKECLEVGIVQGPLLCKINYLMSLLPPCGYSGRYSGFQGGKLNCKVATTEFSKNGVGIETKSVAVVSPQFIHSCSFVACSQTTIGAPRCHLSAPLPYGAPITGHEVEV